MAEQTLVLQLVLTSTLPSGSLERQGTLYMDIWSPNPGYHHIGPIKMGNEVLKGGVVAERYWPNAKMGNSLEKRWGIKRI